MYDKAESVIDGLVLSFIGRNYNLIYTFWTVYSYQHVEYRSCGTFLLKKSTFLRYNYRLEF